MSSYITIYLTLIWTFTCKISKFKHFKGWLCLDIVNHNYSCRRQPIHTTVVCTWWHAVCYSMCTLLLYIIIYKWSCCAHLLHQHYILFFFPFFTQCSFLPPSSTLICIRECLHMTYSWGKNVKEMQGIKVQHEKFKREFCDVETLTYIFIPQSDGPE